MIVPEFKSHNDPHNPVRTDLSPGASVTHWVLSVDPLDGSVQPFTFFLEMREKK